MAQKAENALRLIKGKRRIITARLAVLRHEEKERNLELHQQHNDFRSGSARNRNALLFARCVRLAKEKMEEIHANQC